MQSYLLPIRELSGEGPPSPTPGTAGKEPIRSTCSQFLTHFPAKATLSPWSPIFPLLSNPPVPPQSPPHPSFAELYCQTDVAPDPRPPRLTAKKFLRKRLQRETLFPSPRLLHTSHPFLPPFLPGPGVLISTFSLTNKHHHTSPASLRDALGQNLLFPPSRHYNNWLQVLPLG